MNGTFDHKDEFIKNNGYYMSTPQGNSMRPFIRGGRDSVVMTAFDGNVGKYDVILYRAPDGHHVMHRVLGVKDGICRVRGDNCFYNERVPFDRISAKMDHLIRNGNREVRQTFSYLLLVRLWRAAYPFRFCLHFSKKAVKALLRRARR